MIMIACTDARRTKYGSNEHAAVAWHMGRYVTYVISSMPLHTRIKQLGTKKGEKL